MWNAISLVQDLNSCRRVISYDDNHYTTGYPQLWSPILLYYTHIYVNTYIYRLPPPTFRHTHTHMRIRTSSSYCAICTDIPDRLSPHLPIVNCFRQILRATSHIGTELLYVGSNWTSYLCSSTWRGPQEYITHELVPTSPAVSRVSGLSNLDSFRDGL